MRNFKPISSLNLTYDEAETNYLGSTLRFLMTRPNYIVVLTLSFPGFLQLITIPLISVELIWHKQRFICYVYDF